MTMTRRKRPVRSESRLEIRVMTFNIRYAEADDGEHNWARRRALALARIRAFDPDLLGIQELSDGVQAQYVRRRLQAWQFEGACTEDRDWPSEMAPLLFRRRAFELLDAGRFWLSTSSAVAGSKSWGAAFARTATRAAMRHRATGRPFVFVNTHLDYAPTANERSAALLRRWIDRMAARQPVILTGDFNASKRSLAYSTLARSGLLFDVQGAARRARAAQGTYHAYGKTRRPAAIDWILATEEFVTVSARADRFTKGRLFPSDHYPLTAVLRWKH
jgi:endonuclease/exonuclease/phosphatase family metal-dependent hydrolase